MTCKSVGHQPVVAMKSLQKRGDGAKGHSQCRLYVKMEVEKAVDIPVCWTLFLEAQFFVHSYGFLPMRDAAKTLVDKISCPPDRLLLVC